MEDEKTCKWSTMKYKFMARQAIGKTKLFVKDKYEWVKEHQKETLAAIATLTAAANCGMKMYDRVKAKRDSRYVYDYSMRTHRKLRGGPLTNGQKAEINRLRNEGHSYHDIYNMMNLVK